MASPAENSEKCSLCGCLVQSAEIASHLQKHEKGGGLCPQCPRYIWTKKAMDQHQKWHQQRQAESEQCFCCFYCGKELAISQKQSHIAEHKAREAEKNKKRADEPFICPKCGQQLLHKQQPYHAKVCTGQVKKRNPVFKFEFRLNAEDPAKCVVEECDFVDPRVAKMKKHYERNHVKRPCPECHNVYALHSLRNHMSQMHNKMLPMTKSYLCEVCPKAFPFKYLLKTHSEEEHIKELKHFCHKCGKGFFSKKRLTSHAHESHVRANRKPYCDVCGLTLRHMKQVKEHLKEVHKKDLPKNYQPPFKIVGNN